jgi:hypothetical protein
MLLRASETIMDSSLHISFHSCALSTEQNETKHGAEAETHIHDRKFHQRICFARLHLLGFCQQSSLRLYITFLESLKHSAMHIVQLPEIQIIFALVNSIDYLLYDACSNHVTASDSMIRELWHHKLVR